MAAVFEVETPEPEFTAPLATVETFEVDPPDEC